MKVSTTFLDSPVDVECPDCGYPLEIEVVDVATQVVRRCPCCRKAVQITEPDGSIHGALAAVDSAERKLEKTLKGLF